MQQAGLLLLTLGFLGGAYLAVVHAENEVDWGPFAIAFVVAAVGVALARLATHRSATQTDRLRDEMSVLTRSLTQIVDGITALEADRDIDVYDVHGRIDATVAASLADFADARKSMIPVYGLQAYADVMNHFAAGERYINRVWSCSVDGYIDEVRDFIGRSKEQFSLAQQLLGKLEQQRSSSS